jgi:hypothetical protein
LPNSHNYLELGQITYYNPLTQVGVLFTNPSCGKTVLLKLKKQRIVNAEKGFGYYSLPVAFNAPIISQYVWFRRAHDRLNYDITSVWIKRKELEIAAAQIFNQILPDQKIVNYPYIVSILEQLKRFRPKWQEYDLSSTFKSITLESLGNIPNEKLYYYIILGTVFPCVIPMNQGAEISVNTQKAANIRQLLRSKNIEISNISAMVEIKFYEKQMRITIYKP